MTRRDIGTIRVLDNETLVEIAANRAAEFAASVQRTARSGENIVIAPMDDELAGALTRAERRPPASMRVPGGKGPKNKRRAPQRETQAKDQSAN